eukprot:5027532-Amphidinium_carterae.2
MQASSPHTNSVALFASTEHRRAAWMPSFALQEHFSGGRCAGNMHKLRMKIAACNLVKDLKGKSRVMLNSRINHTDKGWKGQTEVQSCSPKI